MEESNVQVYLPFSFLCAFSFVQFLFNFFFDWLAQLTYSILEHGTLHIMYPPLYRLRQVLRASHLLNFCNLVSNSLICTPFEKQAMYPTVK